ncbi:MAG TPA: UMP kinase [Alphaproteobacteria bacterium]|nr:UMP kinase [Alphaproteobacteria bacterium]
MDKSQILNNSKRFLIKLSGEMLLGDKEFGIDTKTLEIFAKEIKLVVDKGFQIALVIGGGNIFRGVSGSADGLDRADADYMGMLATCMNGIALQNALYKEGVETRVQTAIKMNEVAEPYIRGRALRHIEKGRVVIFVAGTGNPYFTTDTAAALRAVELDCDMLIKATKVDGIYDKDPAKHADAEHFESISYQEVLVKDLKVMDGSAISLCRDNKLPIMVASMAESEGLLKALTNATKTTIVY